MLWLKAIHIIFVVTWFAGLFYLPRLFVYHTQVATEAADEHRRMQVMERKLFAIMTLGGGIAAVFGLWLLFAYHLPTLQNSGWLHAKLLLVVALIAYHVTCLSHVRAFREGRNQRSETWFRWYNEVPAILLIAIVILAVVRPF